jgi:hypothetical protein
MIHTRPMRRSSSYATAPRMGDAAQTFVGASAQFAGAALSTVGTLAAPAVGLITLSSTMAAAIPIAGAVVAVGVLIFSMLHNSTGLRQDAETTAEVNAAAVYMQNNLDAWNASTKNTATQVQALANFDNAWAAVLNFCGKASEGTPGERCISERQRGGQYDFFSYYRDPIANDPQAGVIDRQQLTEAAAAAVPSTVTADGTSSPAGFSLGTLAIPALLIAAAFLVTD